MRTVVVLYIIHQEIETATHTRIYNISCKASTAESGPSVVPYNVSISIEDTMRQTHRRYIYTVRDSSGKVRLQKIHQINAYIIYKSVFAFPRERIVVVGGGL